MDLETLNYIKTIFDKDGHEQAYKELCAKIKSLDSEPQFDSRGRKLCRCGSKPKDHEVRNFDPTWRDGDVHCIPCGGYVRGFDAG